MYVLLLRPSIIFCIILFDAHFYEMYITNCDFFLKLEIIKYIYSNIFSALLFRSILRIYFPNSFLRHYSTSSD